MYTGRTLAPMHLSDFMEKHGLKDKDVAPKIGTSRPTVSRIRRKKCRPDWKTIERMQEWSGNQITADDFLDVGVSA